ncbi:hypothetical protein acdb102_27660 [Acidothermaceae bacterium B102]|nr:hypothetical protein acdb102_27660 [Acidothermaceae bacterium B102]
MDLDAVATELYGLAPADFVATRTARAKEARAAGDRELATAIAALAKPTKVAWLVNQLVRQRPQDVEPLLALGAGLREATATLSGDDLRTLTRQQHQLVHAIVGMAREIAAAAGEPVSQDVADGVDQTLRAALADDGLAAALSGGRLTDRLEFAGFGGAGAGITLPPATRKKPVVPVDDLAAQRKARAARADQAAAEARTALDDAEAAQRSVQEAVAAAVATAEAAEARVAELRAELEAAIAEHVDADKATKAAHASLDQADRGVRGARRRLDAAEAERALL